MSTPTRREFLVAAGSAAASASLIVPDLAAVEENRGADTMAEPTSLPPHRPLAVEGIHAYTDRVSVPAGDVVRFM